MDFHMNTMVIFQFAMSVSHYQRVTILIIPIDLAFPQLPLPQKLHEAEGRDVVLDVLG